MGEGGNEKENQQPNSPIWIGDYLENKTQILLGNQDLKAASPVSMTKVYTSNKI